MRRTLVLKKESLTELTTAELGAVNGGATDPCIDPPSGPCLQTRRIDCLLSTIFVHCPTDPTLPCVE